MAKVTFQLLPHNGGYPINTLIRPAYSFVDDNGVEHFRANPTLRTNGKGAARHQEPRGYKFPAAGWEIDTVSQKAVYEFLRDHPNCVDSLAYKRNTLGYSKEMEDAGVPMPPQGGFYLFKIVDETKERQARMAGEYAKQQASLLLTERIGKLNGEGKIDFVEGGKEVMDKVYYMIYAKKNDDKLAVIESLLGLATSNPTRLIDLLNVDADVYNHKVRVNRWIADGVLSEVEKVLYLNGAAVGSRLDLETKSASKDENDIAFCKNLDELCKPIRGRKPKNA